MDSPFEAESGENAGYSTKNNEKAGVFFSPDSPVFHLKTAGFNVPLKVEPRASPWISMRRL